MCVEKGTNPPGVEYVEKGKIGGVENYAPLPEGLSGTGPINPEYLRMLRDLGLAESKDPKDR